MAMTLTDSRILEHFPPMGIYEVLFSFLDSAGVYMGEPGTHPWAQGFPLTSQLPGGPEMPTHVQFGATDLKYPSATGDKPLIDAIVGYYNNFYDAGITADNVAVFAGGRPGIFATIAFLSHSVQIYIEETEYTPYYDLLHLLKRDYHVIPSNEENRFRPDLDSYKSTLADQNGTGGGNPFFIKSNPCNPTGVTWSGEQLGKFISFVQANRFGGIVDEAYEFFQSPEPESALKYIDDIDQTRLFIVGAATKGLQVPGARIGWVVAARENIEIFRNFSSIAMGGVSRLSQICVAELLQTERVRQARSAVGTFFGEQRKRYEVGLRQLGIELFTGEGGFYHWGRLPGDLTATELNRRLFQHKAAILPGTLCDMHRRGDDGPHQQLFRFSFGPLLPETYERNLEILGRCIASPAASGFQKCAT